MDKQQSEYGNSTMRNIYGFIVVFMTSHGYSPSFKEIAEGTGIRSTATIHDQLLMLEQLGLIHTHGKARTISLVGYKFVKSEVL